MSARADVSGEDSLAAARALFADALRDEDAHRFSDALGKFERVRDVRDTAPIEYRIASCYEGLGRPASAYGAYRDAIVLGRRDAQSADVVGAAAARLEILAPRLSRLTLVMAPTDAVNPDVRIDGAPTPRDKLGEPVTLDPGHHAITATAPGFAPFHSDVALPAGAQASLTITLFPIASPPLPSRVADERPAGSHRVAGWAAVVG
ncbi:MAG: carboxypeptidase-like regulatory domain-containing protein, partial [Polyangiaceae bacterium]